MSGNARGWLERCFETRSERQWLGSLLVTTSLHLFLMLVLALWIASDPTTAAWKSVDSRWTHPEETDFETVPLVAPPVAEANPEAGGRAAAALRALDQPSLERVEEALVLRPTVHTPLPESGLSGVDLLAPVAARSGDTQPGMGRGQGTGDGVGNGDASGFFGVASPGTRFVYVVDASSSMQAKHDSDAKTRFGRVKLELIRSIGGLTPQQSFFVIYFNSVPHPMPARAMQPGLVPLKDHFLEWTTRFRAGGDTNPKEALELALALRPDVVYFLTDGEIARGKNLLRHITGLNRGRTRLHTFAFGTRAGEEMMQALARQNRGEYAFVP